MKTLSGLLLVFFIGTVVWGCAGADIPTNATGDLQISSTPFGTLVYLDSVYQGITPEQKGFISITNLSPRQYSLVLKKETYHDFISTVKIVSGQTVVVAADLRPVEVTSQENPGNSMTTGALVLIGVLVLVGFVVLYIRHRRKPKVPDKVELD